MKNPMIILLCFILLLSFCQPFQMTFSLPVPNQIIVKLNLSIKRLEETLSQLDGPNIDSITLFERVVMTYMYLIEMNYALAQFNNILIGANISITGNKNMVIGSYNTIQGDNNWVFVPNYIGNITGDLVLDKWKIEMDKKELILNDTKLVISLISSQKNKQFKTNLIASIKQPSRVAVIPQVDFDKSEQSPKQESINNQQKLQPNKIGLTQKKYDKVRLIARKKQLNELINQNDPKNVYSNKR